MRARKIGACAGFTEPENSLAYRALRVVGPGVVGIIGAGGQRQPVDLVLGGHGVAQVAVYDLAQVGGAPADRPEVQRGVAVVDGIIVPQEEAVFHDALVRFGSPACDVRRGLAVPGPEDIDVRVQIAAEGLQVSPVVRLGAVAPVGNRTEDQLDGWILAAQTVEDGVYKPGVLGSPGGRSSGAPVHVIQRNAEPMNALALRPGKVLIITIEVFGALQIQRSERVQLGVNGEAERDAVVASGPEHFGEGLLGRFGNRLPPFIAGGAGLPGDKQRPVAVHQEIHLVAGQDGNLLQVLRWRPDPAFDAAELEPGLAFAGRQRFGKRTPVLGQLNVKKRGGGRRTIGCYSAVTGEQDAQRAGSSCFDDLVHINRLSLSTISWPEAPPN